MSKIAYAASERAKAILKMEDLQSLGDTAFKAWHDAGITEEQLWRHEQSRRRMSVLMKYGDHQIVVSAFVSPTLGKALWFSMADEGHKVDSSLRDGQHRI